MRALNNKKVLCFGNADRTTDKIASLIASMNSTVNYGLVDDCNRDIEQNGIYHTSLEDISLLDAELLLFKFDHIIFIDLPITSYSNEQAYHTTRVLYMFVKNWNVKSYNLINERLSTL